MACISQPLNQSPWSEALISIYEASATFSTSLITTRQHTRPSIPTQQCLSPGQYPLWLSCSIAFFHPFTDIYSAYIFSIRPHATEGATKPATQLDPPALQFSEDFLSIVSRTEHLRSQRSLMLVDLCHSASLSGSVSVGSFNYRKQTQTEVAVGLFCSISLSSLVQFRVCVCVCLVPGDDILIFVKFR